MGAFSKTENVIIVVDTNVLISVLFWGGQLQVFGHLIDARRIILAFSPATVDELSRAVHYPHVIAKARRRGIEPIQIVDLLVANSIVVIPKRVVSVVKEDPDDNMFLACAQAAQASFIISGDKHLLALKSFAGIPIITPREFLSFF